MELYTIQFSDPLEQLFEWVTEISESDARWFYNTKPLIYSFYSDFIMNNI